MKKEKRDVYLVQGVRTLLGKPHKTLNRYQAGDLAAGVMRAVMEKSGWDPRDIQRVLLGNTLSAGLGQNFAREAVSRAGLPGDLPAAVINNVCGSGLEALIFGYEGILSGRQDAVLIAAAESVTHAPFLIPREKEEQLRREDVIDSVERDGLRCSLTGKLMGVLAEDLAQKHKISRKQQDEYAFESHRKASHATKEGFFIKEIIDMETAGALASMSDDCIRKRISLEAMAELPAAFREEGTVTAGNSSRICDGAAAVLLSAQRNKAEKERGLQARILACQSVTGDPATTYESGVKVIQACLKEARMTAEHIDLFEICEAFAAQAVYTFEKLQIPVAKRNIWGGDIALGHPMGVSGLRALVTLMNALRTKEKRRGMVCVSFGGGGSIAVMIERF